MSSVEEEIIFLWEVKCLDTGQWVQTWAAEAPTVCPHNQYIEGQHAINPDSVRSIRRLDSKEVKIKEEHIPTRGNYEGRTLTIACGPGYNEKTFLIEVDTNIMIGTVHTTEAQRGDVINILIAKDYPIPFGTVTRPVARGDTKLYLSPMVFLFLQDNKYDLRLTCCGGRKMSNMVRVRQFNMTTGNVDIHPPIDTAFDCDCCAKPQVHMTVRMVRDFQISGPGRYTTGDGKIGGSYLRSFTPITITYYNRSSVHKGNMPFEIECLA
jgi:hypothetical protein